MSFQFMSSSDAFIAVFLLQWTTMILLDRTSLRVRMRDLAGVSARVPFVWFGPGTALTYWRLYGIYLLIRFGEFIFKRHEAPKGAVLSVGQILLLLAGLLAVIASGVAVRIWHRRRISLIDYSISRGQLNTSYRRLAGKARFLLSESIPLYVLPDVDFPRLCRRLRSGAILPRRLLDTLSRGEIDSIAARQMALQSRRFYDQTFWYLLVANCAAAGAAWLLHLGSLPTGLLLLIALTAEIVAIQFLAPVLIVRAYLYAIELVGDPEAFFSAQGALNRFGGEPPPQPMLLEIARKNAVSPDRVAALMADHPIPPEEKRFPTTGSYMDTGL